MPHEGQKVHEAGYEILADVARNPCIFHPSRNFFAKPSARKTLERAKKDVPSQARLRFARPRNGSQMRFFRASLPLSTYRVCGVVISPPFRF
jgi:hypothetical protein